MQVATDGSSPRARARPAGVALGALLLVAALVVTGARPAAARDGSGQRCTRALEGQVRTDTATGASIRCAPGDDGLRWQPVPRGTASAPPATAAPAPTTATAPAPARPGGLVAGARCGGRREGERAMAPSSGTTLECRAGPDGRRWVAAAGGPQVIAPLAGAAGGTGDGAQGSGQGPLPADAGSPGGLPPGVTLPPGTTVRAGSPFRSPAADWWKTWRWQTEADVAGADPEAVHAHFVAACRTLGWRFATARVQRLPDSPPPGRSFEPGARLLIGSCRTSAGSSTDPTRPRPWYLAWSVAQRPGASTTELVVEVRDTNPHGGRPA